jgi:hypothetical protein
MTRRPLLIPLAALLAGLLARAPAAEPDYVYRLVPGDTLIGVSQRLLVEPRRWPELRARNNLGRPDRLPPGTAVRIPRDWLRQSAEQARVDRPAGADAAATPARGAQVGEGARLVTGPGERITLDLADGSVITIGEDSSVGIELMRRVDGTGARDTRLQIERGGVETKVQPQREGSRFEIRTPVAISAVRGTGFRQEFDAVAGLDRTGVAEGAVTVAGAAATADAMAGTGAAPGIAVEAGFGTVSDAAGGPRPPVRLLPPPDLSALPGAFDQDRVDPAFPPVAGAVAYRGELFADAALRDLRAARTAATPALDFGAVADGRYVLRVRAVDALGLAGEDAAREITRQRVPDRPEVRGPAPGAAIAGTQVRLQWAPVASAVRYRVQVATDAVFAAPLLDRDDVTAPELLATTLPAGGFHWRVAGIDARGATGPWSTPASATLQPPPPPHPWWKKAAPLLLFVPLLL